jgi:KipI family sensor histidine kinase inhibitor
MAEHEADENSAAARPDAGTPIRVLSYGERALLIEVQDHLGALALYADLRRNVIDGVIDLIPAASTLLITFVDEPSARAAASSLVAHNIQAGGTSVGPMVEVPVIYDGPDLPAVAERTKLSIDEVITKHTGAQYIAAFIGFAPGFAYLTGLDPALYVPRHDSPRPRVPRGSVGLAGEFTAVYPNASPGGWQLIGRTALQMWALDRQPPALLQPGTRVSFTRIEP